MTALGEARHSCRHMAGKSANRTNDRQVSDMPCLSDMSYKKQLIAPWAQSLVPETCRCAALSASLIEDSVRRAKADFPLVPLCPVKSMAPVLAIAGMVARVVVRTAL